MDNFKERGERRVGRVEFAQQFCVGAEIPIVVMAFFDSRTRSFTETWTGRNGAISKECGQGMIKKVQAHLAVWAALQAKAHPADGSGKRPETTAIFGAWINADEHVIGIGAPIGDVFPVLAFPKDSNRDLPARKALLRMGLAYVAQQLNEDVFARSAWMENLVETALQVLSIQFLVATADGEIRYDSRQEQLNQTGQLGRLVTNGRLSLPSEEENSKLLDAIRAATSDEKRTSIVSIFTSPGMARLVVVTPLATPGSALALVLFESEQTDHFKLREHFFGAYRLTKSESMIAHEILRGRSIAEAAEAKNLSLATVRSYMKQVFAKTGTHRQSELISLYFSSILPLTSELKVTADQHRQ